MSTIARLLCLLLRPSNTMRDCAIDSLRFASLFFSIFFKMKLNCLDEDIFEVDANCLRSSVEYPCKADSVISVLKTAYIYEKIFKWKIPVFWISLGV